MDPLANQANGQEQQQQEGVAVEDDSGFDRRSIASSTREARIARAERWVFPQAPRMDPSTSSVNLNDYCENIKDIMTMTGRNFTTSIDQLNEDFLPGIRSLGEREYGSPRHVMRISQYRTFVNTCANKLLEEIHFGLEDMNGFDIHGAAALRFGQGGGGCEVKDEPLHSGTGPRSSGCGVVSGQEGPTSSGFVAASSASVPVSLSFVPTPSSCNLNSGPTVTVSCVGPVLSSYGTIPSGPEPEMALSNCSRPGITHSGPTSTRLDSGPPPSDRASNIPSETERNRSEPNCPPGVDPFDKTTTSQILVQEEPSVNADDQNESFRAEDAINQDEIGIDIKYECEDLSHSNVNQSQKDFIIPSTPVHGGSSSNINVTDDKEYTSPVHIPKIKRHPRRKPKQDKSTPKNKADESPNSGISTTKQTESFMAGNQSTSEIRIPVSSLTDADPKLQAVCKVTMEKVPIQTIIQMRASRRMNSSVSSVASEHDQEEPVSVEEVSANDQDNVNLKDDNAFMEIDVDGVPVQPSSTVNEHKVVHDVIPVVDGVSEEPDSDDSRKSVDSLKLFQRVLAGLEKPTRYSSDEDGEIVDTEDDILASKPDHEKTKKKRKRKKKASESDSDSDSEDWELRYRNGSDIKVESDDATVFQGFGKGLSLLDNPDLSELLPSPFSQQSDSTVAQGQGHAEDNEDDIDKLKVLADSSDDDDDDEKAKAKVLFGSDDENDNDEPAGDEPKKAKANQPQSKSSNRAGPSAPYTYTPRISVPGLGSLNSFSSDTSTTDMDTPKRKVLKKKSVKREIRSDDEDDASEDDGGKLPIPHRRIKRLIESDCENESTGSRSDSSSDSDSDRKDLDSPTLTRSPDSKKSSPKKRKRSPSVNLISSDSENEPSSSHQEPLIKKPKSEGNFELFHVSSSTAESEEDDDCQVIEMKLASGKIARKGRPRSPALTGRRNIRPIKSDKELSLQTQEIEKAEAERQLLIEAKNKEVLAAVSQFREQDNSLNLREAIVLDVNSETKEPVVVIHDGFARKLEQHQIEGIKFMWNACYISASEVENEGSGCILAHCMGLGKSFQVIAFLHAIMTSEATRVKSALIVCPVNAAANWDEEFDKWQSDVYPTLQVYKFWSDGRGGGNRTRFSKLREWTELGGVGIINYDALASLVLPEKAVKADAKRKRQPRTPDQLDIISEALISPGPDLIICDEGHVLKNSTSNRARAILQFRSKRRVILTGTPLQNNLMEYFVMVSLVKPGLLGSKEEFMNRFENPIKNGQHLDSLASDVKLMKQRSHVLHKLVKDIVHRRGLKVLKDKLPKKFDFALNIKLTPTQVSLYTAFGDWIEQQEMSFGKGLFKYFHEFVRIISHPWALQLRNTKEQKIPKEMLNKGNALDFVLNENELKELERDESSKDGLEEPEQDLLGKNSRANFFSQFFADENKMRKAEMSLKLLVLREILEGCEKVGDKVLLFSQYMFNLDMIEYYLMEWSREEGTTTNKFVKNKDFFRLDGNVGVADRRKLIKKFNSNTSRVRLFLISTNAGSLGVNLVAANRVVMFDTSWNPSADLQGVFRAYRLGQTKPCYVYRLISKGTLEQRIYERQLVKLALSCRVVDNEQMKRHFFKSLKDIYKYNEEPESNPLLGLSRGQAHPEDNIISTILSKHPEWDLTYNVHDSFLEDQEDEKLTTDEKTQAWVEYTNNTNTANFPPPKPKRGRPKRGTKPGPSTESSISTSSTFNPPPPPPPPPVGCSQFRVSEDLAPVQVPVGTQGSVPTQSLVLSASVSLQQQVRRAILKLISKSAVCTNKYGIRTAIANFMAKKNPGLISSNITHQIIEENSPVYAQLLEEFKTRHPSVPASEETFVLTHTKTLLSELRILLKHGFKPENQQQFNQNEIVPRMKQIVGTLSRYYGNKDWAAILDSIDGTKESEGSERNGNGS